MNTSQIIRKCPDWLFHRIRIIAKEIQMTLDEAIVFLLSKGVNTYKENHSSIKKKAVFISLKGVNTSPKGGAQ